MLGLKRKGSLSPRTQNHKSLRTSGTTVDSFVYRPRNEEYLGDIHECRLEPLRTAMAVDAAQFNRITERLRSLANELLNVDLAWDEQDADVRADFLTKVHEKYPVFRSKFEDGWPVVVYTRRYLENKSKRSYRKRGHDESWDKFSLGHQRTWSNVQSFVAKPLNVDQLLYATEQDIRRAMDFDGTQFRSIQSLLQSLAKKYLNVNELYENQDHRQRRLLVQEASVAEPLFSTKYEGAWPIDIFLKRYLNQRAREASANLPSWTSGGREGPAPTLAGAFSMTQAASTNNCAYRYPPMLPPYSQFTWSAANFATSSSSRLRSPSVEFCDADEENIPSSPAPYPASSNNINHTTASNDKENTPPAHAPPSMSSDDHSAPVREFLRSSNPNLESLLPRFCELGIEDFETLRAFKTWTSDEREELLLGGHFNKLQRLAVQRKADQLASR